jgi:sigma-B regulation protein RsbU (phosphoserine phosphatase)
VILDSDGFPISMADEAYKERSVCLKAGDRMYLYSDGVTEALDPGGQQFGNTRLLAAIGQGRFEPLQQSVAILLEQIARWQGRVKPHDDVSILALEFTIPPGKDEPHVASRMRHWPDERHRASE